MEDKLTGQLCVDELDVGRRAKDVGQKVRTLGGEDDAEHLVLEDKGEDSEECHHDDASQEHSTKFFEMVPESHKGKNLKVISEK